MSVSSRTWNIGTDDEWFRFKITNLTFPDDESAYSIVYSVYDDTSGALVSSKREDLSSKEALRVNKNTYYPNSKIPRTRFISKITFAASWIPQDPQ